MMDGDTVKAMADALESLSKGRYDELFESLRVEEGRYNCVNVHFSICYGTGKKFRELTEREKEEVAEHCISVFFERWNSLTLQSGAKVVRKLR